MGASVSMSFAEARAGVAEVWSSVGWPVTEIGLSVGWPVTEVWLSVGWPVG